MSDFRVLAVGAPPAGIVPAWAEYILASADVQKDRLYWIVRAWGAGYRSQLISYGVVGTFAQLVKETLQTQFTLAAGGPAGAHALFPDTRYRADEVYAIARTDARILPVMGGAETQAMPVRRSEAGNAWGVTLHTLNTGLLKDRMAVLRRDPGQWLLNNQVGEDYLHHLASEHKILIQGIERWVQKSSGLPNHYLDCEVYSVAGAEICRVDKLESGDHSTPAMAMPADSPIKEMSSEGGNTNRGWLSNMDGRLKR